MPAQKKIKLRTASDVLSRLKWSDDEQELNAQNTIVGYDCRIYGPMEKCVDDYAGINEGGDIPNIESNTSAKLEPRIMGNWSFGIAMDE